MAVWPGFVGIEAELGYWLAEERWGRGYATEAGAAVLAHHFADAEAGDVVSGYFVANDKSGHVLNKLGFRPTEERRRFCLARGYEVDSQAMVLTRAAWQARHG
jgi:RimJ/RimL family protein N-acetyltransferase